MKVELSTEVKVTITMNEQEAAWLHGAMQNPLHAEHPNSESDYDKVIRFAFFEATKPK